MEYGKIINIELLGGIHHKILCVGRREEDNKNVVLIRKSLVNPGGIDAYIIEENGDCNKVHLTKYEREYANKILNLRGL